MEVLKDEVTGMSYVFVNGEMFVRRDDMGQLPLSYLPRDMINRIGEGNGHSWGQLKDAKSRPTGVTIS